MGHPGWTILIPTFSRPPRHFRHGMRCARSAQRRVVRALATERLAFNGNEQPVSLFKTGHDQKWRIVLNSDPAFTPTVINATGPKASPRAREVFTALCFKHVHEFARDVELTIEEWQLGMQFLDEVGHMYFTSDKKRHEMHRISDIIGLERFVNLIK